MYNGLTGTPSMLSFSVPRKSSDISSSPIVHGDEIDPNVNPDFKVGIDEFGRSARQQEWGKGYVPCVERDHEGDIIPDGCWSENDSDDDHTKDIINPGDNRIHDIIHDSDDYPGCEVIEADAEPELALRPNDDFHNEPISEQKSDPRLAYLEYAVGKEKVALMQELGVLEQVVSMLPQDSAMVVTTDEPDAPAMSMEDFVETDIVLTLDSGCCDHIADMADFPGYAHMLTPSLGSERGQRFVVGNGDRVKNQGQVKVRMKSKDESGVLMSSVFQIAEITRPLMSVSRICDQDMVCVFTKSHAKILNQKGDEVARFERDGGLYTCTMRLKKPVEKPVVKNNGQGFARPV